MRRNAIWLRLLFLPLLWAAVPSAVSAQALKFEEPSDWRIFRSPMLLIQQSNWVDITYVRGMGVKVEAAGPGLADRALRVDSTLVLRIDGGRILHIFDLPDLITEDGALQHRFEAWLPESRHYVVTAPCIHCRVTYLIDARDGRVANIGVPPIVSPSSRLGILWQQNFMDGPYGPTLIDLRSSPPTLISIPPASTCNAQTFLLRPTATWLDDSRIEFTGALAMPTPKGFAEKQILRIIDGKPVWEC